MTFYAKWPKAPGATKEEVETLKSLNATEIINSCVATKKSRAVTRNMYYNFISGKEVPVFVRQKIMSFVKKKAAKLKRLSEKSEDNGVKKPKALTEESKEK